MPPSLPCIIVMVTAPDMDVARKIASAALQAHLVACANLIPQVESRYWWEGKLETTSEVMIFFKTVLDNRDALQKCVVENHPYKVPEFIVTNIDGASAEYLAWIRQSVLR